MSYLEIVNSTARNRGAVGRNPIAFKYFKQQSYHPGLRVLDFGAGPTAAHSLDLADHGYYDVIPFEVGKNFDPAIHDPLALRSSYDVVIASNVLNVQPSMEYLNWVLATLRSAVDRSQSGALIANYPRSPRRLPLITVDSMLTTLMMYFNEVEQPAGFGRMLYVCSDPYQHL